MNKRCALVILLVTMGIAQGADNGSFDVSSLKLAPEHPRGPVVVAEGPGAVRYAGSLLQLLSVAYEAELERIKGPSWISTTYVIVDARATTGATRHQIHEMLASLLRVRFDMRIRVEQRKFPAYELLTTKEVKIKPSQPAPDDASELDLPRPAERAQLTLEREGFPVPPPGSTYASSVKDHVTRATFRNITIQEAARMLQFDLGIETGGGLNPMRIVDETGLTGNYTFRLYYQMPVPNSIGPTGNAPDLLTAIQKQLGLRLQKGVGVMLDVYTIDQAQKIPIEN
jgi:uncharacterized protein (TIGR03435 family)